jgi:hypothetical protein
METEDERIIFLRHSADVINEFGMFLAIRDNVWKFIESTVELILRSEDIVIQPELTIGDEQFSVQVICNSTTILYLSYHILDGFP